jgi:hypothetical protein
MVRKTPWEKDYEKPMRVQKDCHTDRGQGRKITTGDGRETIKDRSADY